MYDGDYDGDYDYDNVPILKMMVMIIANYGHDISDTQMMIIDDDDDYR
jgi:hypothetical protein